MTWPTDRPGYPRDAERDGWHWLMIGHGVGHSFPMLWCADGEMWEAGDDGYVAAADISTRWNYLGPCYTQADLDAAVQIKNEHNKLVAALQRWYNTGCPICGGDCVKAGRSVINCIMQETIELLHNIKGPII